MAGKGGAIAGNGRKPKADEEKANTIFINALKQVYSKENDDEAKIEFVKTALLTTQRGQIFVAEHVFGKAKETVDNHHTLKNFSLKDVLSFDNSKS